MTGKNDLTSCPSTLCSSTTRCEVKA
uniref:Uncharacterized protein n=1 Tax=Anguilla anguilla TaxID=7936 RepID=A0A0E9P5Z0_ANGAN